MNIFRITGMPPSTALMELSGRKLIMYSGLVPPRLDSHPAAKNAILKCPCLAKPSLPSSSPAKLSTELFWHIVQIASSLSHCLYHKISRCADPSPKPICNHVAEPSGADIFWTFHTGSLWNTTFKILFLGSSAYTVWLMLNDYKPTHDPNIDTFKVQYLLGGAAVLAIVFPYKYQPTEVDALPLHPCGSHN